MVKKVVWPLTIAAFLGGMTVGCRKTPIYSQVPAAADPMPKDKDREMISLGHSSFPEIPHKPKYLNAKEQAALLQPLPAAMRTRVKKLLGQKYNPCPFAAGFPKSCYETVFYVLGIKAIASDKYSGSFKASGPGKEMEFEKYIKSQGYSVVDKISPFIVEESRTEELPIIVRVKNPAIPRKIVPGSIIVFGYHEGKKENGSEIISNHAAVYLGKIKGENIVFQKRSLYCGPESPYGYYSLEQALRDNIGQSAMDESIFNQIFVLRK